MAKTTRRPIAVLHSKKLLQIGAFILKVRTVIKNIGDHPAIFVSPSPALSAVTAHLDELEAAETVALTRVTGSVTTRDVKYKAVRRYVNGLMSYVQQLADNASDEEAAINIIENSGFSVKQHGVISKPKLAAKNSKVSRSIRLIAWGAGKRNSHEWQMGMNVNNWITLPSTLKAKTEVTDLKRLTTMYFRHRVITKDGPLDWSDVVNIVVL